MKPEMMHIACPPLLPLMDEVRFYVIPVHTNFLTILDVFLISNFCPVLNVQRFLLASKFYMPTFQYALSAPSA